MLKPSQPDQTEQNLSSLVNSRHAVQFLYEESLANGNADITLILEQALTCCDELITEGQEISYESKEALLCLFFLKAILGLHAEKIAHLVALLRWLKMIPRETAAGKPAISENDRRSNGAGKT
jgi:hypothetical protein